MSIGETPHEFWAEVYDMVYQRSFGEFYSLLTELTIETINAIVKPKSKIIDFGAGTGRLSIPLSNSGFIVTAIEPSKEMIGQLKKKDSQDSIKAIVSTMQDFKGSGDQDLGLCVFTVLLYLLDESSLRDALSSAFDSLKNDALFLIDIPSKTLFHGYTFNDDVISRHVDIQNIDGDIYEYVEKLTVATVADNDIEYSDTFQIKYWPKKTVLNLLEELGFILMQDLSEEFAITGSEYLIFKKHKAQFALNVDTINPTSTRSQYLLRC